LAIIHQKDNRSGITYAYESVSHWDKGKKQSRSKRTLIGRVDTATGKVIPTDGRCRKDKEAPSETEGGRKRGVRPRTATARKYFGATYLLDEIGKKLGIADDLAACFPDTFKQIESIAYYLILEPHNPLFRFGHWHETHAHPYGKDIPSQRSSDLFAQISEEQRIAFFSLQARRRLETEYWAYDTTSISSYSRTLLQAQHGHNKEDDKLPQLNLALLFGESSGLPFYYRELPGNVPDSKTVRVLLEELDLFGHRKIKVVMDRGFYSEDNINSLYKERVKFLVGVKTSCKTARDAIESVRDSIRHFSCYDDIQDIYGATMCAEWDYSERRPYKKDIIKEKRRLYIQVYYSIEKAADSERTFNKKLSRTKAELMDDKRSEGCREAHAKYFDKTSTPARGVRVSENEDAINESRRNFGFFTLITNEKMDAMIALKIYRTKDVVEKAFGNLKERLNMRRTLVSSEQSLDGKIFVEFVALIYVSYIHKMMQDNKLYKDYTMNEALDKLDVIECFDRPGKKRLVGEVLEKQKSLYEKLEVKPPPTSL
jgi:transposase